MIHKFVALALLCCIACLGQRASAHGFEMEVEALDNNEPAVVVEGTTFTVGTLKELLALRPPPAPPGDFVFFGFNNLADAGAREPIYTELANQARAEGLALSQEDRDYIESHRRDFLNRLLFNEEIVDKIETPTVDDLRVIYEEQKEERFMSEERLILRELFFPASTDEEWAQAKEFAEAAHDALEGGQRFNVVAHTTEGNEAPAVAKVLTRSDLRGSPEVLYDEGKAISDREFSDLIKTESGYYIIYRQLLMPSRVIPLEAALNVLMFQHQLEKRREAIEKYFEVLASDQSIFQINLTNLANQGSLASDSDLMAFVGEREFTRGELIAAGGWSLSKETRFSEVSFKEEILRLGPVQQALLDVVISRRELDSDPRTAEFIEFAQETVLAHKLLRNQLADSDFSPDELQLRSYTGVSDLGELPEEELSSWRDQLTEFNIQRAIEQQIAEAAKSIDIEVLIDLGG